MTTTNEDDFIEQVIKYIKLDDVIKEKQKKDKEELNILKNKKSIFEKNIISHLNQTENTFINIGAKSKLVKNTSTTKGAINKDLIRSSISDGLQQTELVKDNEDLSNKVIETILNLLEKKRPIKQKEYLRRVNPKKK